MLNHNLKERPNANKLCQLYREQAAKMKKPCKSPSTASAMEKTPVETIRFIRVSFIFRELSVEEPSNKIENITKMKRKRRRSCKSYKQKRIF